MDPHACMPTLCTAVKRRWALREEQRHDRPSPPHTPTRKIGNASALVAACTTATLPMESKHL